MTQDRPAAPVTRSASGIGRTAGLRLVRLTRTLSRVLAPQVRAGSRGEWMQRTLGDNYERLMERRAT